MSNLYPIKLHIRYTKKKSLNWPFSNKAPLVANPWRSVYIAYKIATDAGAFFSIGRHFVSNIHWSAWVCHQSKPTTYPPPPFFAICSHLSQCLISEETPTPKSSYTKEQINRTNKSKDRGRIIQNMAPNHPEAGAEFVGVEFVRSGIVYGWGTKAR